MANPIVTTNPATNIENREFDVSGYSTNPDWKVTNWGFYYYLKSLGAEYKQYISARESIGDGSGGSFSASVSGLTCYTEYVFCAVVHYVNNEETEDITIYGSWREVRTDAVATVRTVVAFNVTKYPTAVNTANLTGVIIDDVDGQILESGFKYGFGKNDSFDIHTTGGIRGRYTLQVTSLNGNSDYYFRSYVVTPTGTYHSDIYVKFTTKDITPLGYLLIVFEGYELSDTEFYISPFGLDGKIINAFPLGTENTYYGQNCIAANKDNIFILDDNNYLHKFDLSGNQLAIKKASGVGADSIAMNKDGDNLYIRGRDSDFHYIQSIDLETLNVGDISEIIKWSTNPRYYQGLSIDRDENVYFIDLVNKKLLKYKISNSQYDYFYAENVNPNTDIITLTIDIETGTPIELWSYGTIPSPLQEGITYWVIRIAENQIRLATSLQNALDGVCIDITNTGEGEQEIDVISFYQEAELDISSVYADYNYIATGGFVYSNEYGENGWVAPLSLESLTEWNPSELSYIKSLGSGLDFVFITGIGIAGDEYSNYLCIYDNSKSLVWKTALPEELDFYSICGITGKYFLKNIKAERRKSLARIRLYGEIL